MDLKFVAQGFFWFIAWTVISFMAHFFAKRSFAGLTKQADTTSMERWYLSVVLSVMQTFMGFAVLQGVLSIPSLRRYLSNPKPSSNLPSTTTEQSPRQQPSTTAPQAKNGSSGDFQVSVATLALSHLTATLFTNASLAFGNAGSAFTVKAFEPVTSAILTSLLLGKKQGSHVLASLPLVVGGAIGFVWQPGIHAAGILSLGLAFSSNLLYGIRNIHIKQTHQQSQGGVSMLAKLEVLQSMSMYTTGLLVVPAILLAMAHSDTRVELIQCLVSGACHITYTVISTCIILKYMSVVAHSTCNLLKRLFLAVAFFALGNRVPAASNWVMLVVLVVGLIIYTFPKVTERRGLNNPSLLLVVMVTVIVMLTSTMSMTLPTPPSKIPQPPHYALLSPNDIKFMESTRIYEHPTLANRISNKMTTTTGLIEEAHRLHDQVFPHIMSKYKRAVLVNVFQWFNKGDHLITIGQRKILHRMNIRLIHHCFYPGRNCDYSKVPKDEDVIVLVQGAGYIGHPSHKFVLENTIKHFPKNRLMVFPISVCHPTAPCNEIEEFAKIFSKHKDAHVVFRDRYSYDLGAKHFRNVHNYMAPDSAFAVGPIRLDIVPVYDIIWLKRDDWEGTGDPMPSPPANVRMQITDWKKAWMNENVQDFWEDHQLQSMSGVAFLARGKVIVTDRLHAHLMSQLMDKPNVVINSKTKKAEHYFTTWKKSVKGCRLVNSNVDALKAALELLKKVK